MEPRFLTTLAGLRGTQHLHANTEVAALVYRAARTTELDFNALGVLYAFGDRKDALLFQSMNDRPRVALVALRAGITVAEVPDFVIELLGFNAGAIEALRAAGIAAVVNAGMDGLPRGGMWLILERDAVLSAR